MKRDNPEILNKYAWTIYVFKLNQDYNLALEYSQKAVSMNSNKANYLATQAWLYYGTGNREKGIESMKRAIEINPHPEYKKNLETMISSKQ